jgi:hypothetical protein
MKVVLNPKEAVEMPNTSEERVADADPDAPANSDHLARQEAIKQIERRRRFRINTAIWGLAMLILVAIWAISEFHKAGGWPTQGFSQSSGIHHVWNIWIIYPVLGWVFLTAAAWWKVSLRKPISEAEIKREIERQSGAGDKAA